MCTTTDHTEWFGAAQTQLEQNDLWEQEIVPRLPADLGEQAKGLGALQRRRGIKQASDLLRAILSWILCQRSLRQLGAWAVLLGLADLTDRGLAQTTGEMWRLAPLAGTRSTGRSRQTSDEAERNGTGLDRRWNPDAASPSRQTRRVGRANHV